MFIFFDPMSTQFLWFRVRANTFRVLTEPFTHRK